MTPGRPLHRITEPAYGVSCFRPFALLLLIILLPALVDIRNKKPWVRARFILLG